MAGSVPYGALASTIFRGRKAANLNQGDLAGFLGIKQQSVSRWEAGTHRPDVGQIPAIATAIRADTDELMYLAGYGVPVSITAPPPFPVDALAPFSFEQLT